MILRGRSRRSKNAEALREAYRSIEDPDELRNFLRSFTAQDSGFAVANEESRAFIEELASTANTTVYVYCTPCKHIFKKTLP